MWVLAYIKISYVYVFVIRVWVRETLKTPQPQIVLKSEVCGVFFVLITSQVFTFVSVVLYECVILDRDQASM